MSFHNNEILPVYAKMNGLFVSKGNLCEVHMFDNDIMALLQQ